MKLACPECGSRTWMRAVRIVEFRPLSPLMALWFGAVAERLVGYNGVCSECGTPARVDGNGAKRLMAAVPKGRQDDAPRAPDKPEPKREPMQINRTPGMVWTRGER